MCVCVRERERREMDADIRNALQNAAHIADQSQKVEQYRILLSSIIASSNAAHAKAFIDQMVSGEVSAAVSSPLLRTLLHELMKMEPESCKDVTKYASLMIPRDDTSGEEENHFPIARAELKAGRTSRVLLDESHASRSYHTATAVGNKLVFFGGIRDNEPLNDVHIFDTVSGSWILPKVLGTPPSPRHSHSAVRLNEERILIFGGYGSTPQDMIWLLEVDTPYVKRQSEQLGRKVVAWSKAVLGNMPQPVVICGPSGVGKGTLITRLMKDFPSMFGFSVSHTTRQPRQAEKKGIHYHFTERKEMELAIQEGNFLESADVHGNLYGTSIAAVEAVADAGKRCILDIDVQGAQAVKKNGLDALFIFIAPPSLEQLESRLRGRGTETEEQVQKRLNNAKAELEHGRNSLLFDHYVVNDDLENCYLEVKKLLGLELVNSDTMQDGFNKQVSLKTRYAHSASIIGQKVFIFGGDNERNIQNSLTILDTSKLAGGAPGQTRGLRFSSIEPRHEIANGSTTPSSLCVSSKCKKSLTKENGHL